MKAALANVQVADLPGLGRNTGFAGFFAPTGAAPAGADRLNASDRLIASAPLAPATVAAGGNVRPEADRGLDGWFLDRLFGRR